jgi:hypothetical protein
MALPNFHTTLNTILHTLDHAVEEFLEQSQRSVLHRTVNAVESFILFAIEKIKLLPVSTHHVHSHLATDAAAQVTQGGTSGASAVLLSYTPTKEAGISARLNRRIRRMMHHTVDLRPFEATVRLFDLDTDTEDDEGQEEEDDEEDDEEDEEEALLSVTPQHHHHRQEHTPTLDASSPLATKKPNQKASPSSTRSTRSTRSSRSTQATRATRSSSLFNKISPLKKSPTKRAPKQTSPTMHRGSPRVVMYTPMSFPPSPRARREVLSNFSTATEKLLQSARSILEEEIKVRKRLRLDSDQTSTNGGTPLSCAVVQFGKSHPNIVLTLGDSGVTLNGGGGTTKSALKKTGSSSSLSSLTSMPSSLSSLSLSTSRPPVAPAICCTVRSSVPLPSSTSDDVNVYYEYHVSHLSNTSKNVTLSVGLSTTNFPLHVDVGTSTSNECCGALFHAKSPQPLRLGDTIGVLTKVRRSPNQEVCTATVCLSINGVAIKTEHRITLVVKTTEQMWPSLTLKSNLFVLGFFGSGDIRYPPLMEEVVVGLDGVVL